MVWPEGKFKGGSSGGLLTAAGQLETTGQHRVHHQPVPVEVDVEKLARARHARDPLAREGLELGRSPANGKRHQGADRGHAPPDEGRVERVGDDIEVGQLGHGRRLYARDRGARLAPPMGTDS